jgi:hypothetical protein
MLFNESERLGSIARKQDEAKERMIFKLKNQPDEDVFWIMEKVRRREERTRNRESTWTMFYYLRRPLQTPLDP